MASPLADATNADVDSLNAHSHADQAQPAILPTTEPGTEPTNETSSETEYVSKIGILASSMPYYHNQYMEKRKATQLEDEGEPLEPHEAEYFAKLSIETNPKEQSSEQQAATARRLKPHSRSTIQLQNITATAIDLENASQANSKKGRQTKWQFGIRSRNQPMDAISCIYKALKAQGAQWHVPGPKESQQESGPYPVNVAGATHLSSAESQLSESPEKEKHIRREDHYQTYEHAPNSATEKSDQKVSGNSRPNGPDDSDSENDDDVDINVFPPGYLPKDPWCIHVRFLKEGMFPPGTLHNNSAHSSRIDLLEDDKAKRRASVVGSLTSAAGSATSVVPGTSDSACYVYMDVQLYTLEADTYLVDFKCAGYETLLEVAVSESEKKLVGSGIRVLDKDVTSPQPFLDLTNKLVIQLAKG